MLAESPQQFLVTPEMAPHKISNFRMNFPAFAPFSAFLV